MRQQPELAGGSRRARHDRGRPDCGRMTTDTVQADDGGLVAAEARSRERAAEVAMGNEQADVVVRGGRIVDVYTGRIMVADVAIAGDRIASVGDVSRCVGSGTEQI